MAALALPHLQPSLDARRTGPGDQLPGPTRPLPRVRHADRARCPHSGGAQRPCPGAALGDHRMRAPAPGAQRRHRGFAGFLDGAWRHRGSPKRGLNAAMTTAKARYRLGNHGMKIAEPAMRNVVGVRRVLGLTLLLAAVAAVAYLERSVGGDFDLRLVYFLIVLSGAMLLPRPVALAVAAAVAIVSVGVTGVTGTALIINGLTHLVMYGYATLLTSNWEQERRRLMRMSRIDGLTGLRNLRALQEQLPTWLGPAARTGRPMALMMMDVDGFKTVNDQLGHGVGNEVLKEVANLLRFAVRVGDEPFRFGGDEFVLLLSDADGAGALIVAQRIQDIYRSMGQTLRGTDVEVSFSIGIAVFPDDGSSPQDLLQRADEALLHAQRTGPAQGA